MVVEHVFITTLDAPDALRLASQFLGTRGFEAVAQGAFALGVADGWNVLEMTRGKKNPGKAKSVVQLPQQVRLEWDRGRVTVAASATSLVESRATTFTRKLKGKPAEWQREMLMSICTQLQQLLDARVAPEEAAAAWGQTDATIDARDRARRRRNKRVAIVVLGLAFGGLAAVIYLAANSR